MAAQIRPDRIKRQMESLNLKPGQVAYRTGLSPAQIYRLLAGERPRAAATTIARLAEGLHTTTDYLLGLTPNSRRIEDSFSPQTEIEWQLLEKFRDLTVDEQRYIIAQLDLALDIFSRPAYRVIGGVSDDEAQEEGAETTAQRSASGT